MSDGQIRGGDKWIESGGEGARARDRYTDRQKERQTGTQADR